MRTPYRSIKGTNSSGVSGGMSDGQFIKMVQQSGERHQIDVTASMSYIFSGNGYIAINDTYENYVYLNGELLYDGYWSDSSSYKIGAMFLTASQGDEVTFVTRDAYHDTKSMSGRIVDFYNGAPVTPDWLDECLCFTAEEDGSWVKLNQDFSTQPKNGFLYSRDGVTWTQHGNFNTPKLTLTNIGDKLYYRSDSFTDTTLSIQNRKFNFKMGGKIAASGNVNYLLNMNGTENLSDYCFRGLFEGCTSLTSLPDLPSTNLKNSCYNRMFYGCSNIKLSTTQEGDYQTPYRIPTEGEGTTATDAMTNMFYNTGGTFKGTPTVNTTYYLSIT